MTNSVAQPKRRQIRDRRTSPLHQTHEGKPIARRTTDRGQTSRNFSRQMKVGRSTMGPVTNPHATQSCACPRKRSIPLQGECAAVRTQTGICPRVTFPVRVSLSVRRSYSLGVLKDALHRGFLESFPYSCDDLTPDLTPEQISCSLLVRGPMAYSHCAARSLI